MLTGNQAVGRFPEQGRNQQQDDQSDGQRNGARPALVLFVFLENAKRSDYDPPGAIGNQPVAIGVAASKRLQEAGAHVSVKIGIGVRAATGILRLRHLSDRADPVFPAPNC